jgi:hypothetical protein
LEYFSHDQAASGENCRSSANVAIANEKLGHRTEVEKIAKACLQQSDFLDFEARGVYYQLLGLNDFALSAYIKDVQAFPEGTAYLHAENLLRELGRSADADQIEAAHKAQMKAQKGPSGWRMLLEGLSEGLAQQPGSQRGGAPTTGTNPGSQGGSGQAGPQTQSSREGDVCSPKDASQATECRWRRDLDGMLTCTAGLKHSNGAWVSCAER